MQLCNKSSVKVHFIKIFNIVNRPLTDSLQVMVQQPCMTQSFDVMLSNAQASYHGGYPVTVYPTVSYPHEILSSAPPPYADHHQVVT